MSRRKHKKPQLKVVFDTSALFVQSENVGSVSDLVRHEIADLINKSKYPDLEILWYLPEIVRHERQYQMRSEAQQLRPAINKIERLLGGSLGLLAEPVLLDRISSSIDAVEKALGLQEIRVDFSRVDWNSMIRAASYRLPPFEIGKKEKGFRDAIVAESFLQLAEDSPRTPTLCRVVIVTADKLLSTAVKARIESFSNASILANLEELTGLVNSLVSDIDQELIDTLKAKAEKMFFVQGETKTLFYKVDVHKLIAEQFTAELNARPEGTHFRVNEDWSVGSTTFVKKERKRIFWATRIEIEALAGTEKTARPLPAVAESAKNAPSVGGVGGLGTYGGYSGYVASLEGTLEQASYSPYLRRPFPFQNRLVTHAGKDVYQIVWHTSVTPKKELTRPGIDEINHVETTWGSGWSALGGQP